jgi:hypothetical protein
LKKGFCGHGCLFAKMVSRVQRYHFSSKWQALKLKKTFQKEEEADSGSDMSAKKEERNLLSPMSFLIDNEPVTVKGRERGSSFVQRQGGLALT